MQASGGAESHCPPLPTRQPEGLGESQCPLPPEPAPAAPAALSLLAAQHSPRSPHTDRTPSVQPPQLSHPLAPGQGLTPAGTPDSVSARLV